MLSAFRQPSGRQALFDAPAHHTAIGARIIYHCNDRLAHGFTAFTGAVPDAAAACHEIAGLVREALEGRIARAVG